MLLDDVRTALEERAESVRAAALEPHETLARVRRKTRQRRRIRLMAAVGVVAAISGGVAFAVGTNDSPGDKVVAISGAPTTATTTTTAEPRLSLTDTQLRAHDGVDAPVGWDPIDAGGGRVFVPDDWSLEDVGTCIGGEAPGMASIGRLAQSNCPPPSQFPVPAEAVSIIPWTGQPTGPVVRTVHGYGVYRTSVGGSGVGWTRYDVPKLGIVVAVRGTLQNRILDTLAPSSRTVALAFAAQRASPGRTVSGDGIRLMIPASWTVVTPQFFPCDTFRSLPGETPAMLRITPGIGALGCPAILPTVADVLGDGLYLFTAPATAASVPSGPPTAVLHHQQTTIQVYAEQNQPNMLQLLVRRTGSSVAHSLYLGLGRNGRIAGSVLASIEATT